MEAMVIDGFKGRLVILAVFALCWTVYGFYALPKMDMLLLLRTLRGFLSKQKIYI